MRRGRPRNATNSQINLNWGNLCCDLRCMKEFEVPMDNSVIKYKINKGEYLAIEKNDKEEYLVSYYVGNVVIPCQKIPDSKNLDDFLGNLLMDDWDFSIEGKITQFKTKN